MHGSQLATDIIAATTTISKHPTPTYIACVTATVVT